MKKNNRVSTLAVAAAVSMVVTQSQVSFAQGNDEPDLAKEARFHRIYKSYNENPTSEDRWQSAIGSATAQTYSVQNGDTLWSLSETLFGDSQFWPKIWSINNSKIENPHLIVPTQVVQFMPGTLGEAPSLTVTDAATQTPTPAVLDDGSPAPAPDINTLLSKAPVPPSSVKTRALSGLPASLPKWQFKEDKRAVIDLELTPINRNFGSPAQSLAYYVTEEDVRGMGTVTETELAMGSASEFQYIFVRMPANSSGKFLVVKSVDAIKDPYSGKVGSLMQIQGEIQILENVNGEDEIYRAIVTKTVGPVEVGGKIVAGEVPIYNAKDEGNPGTANVRIVGGAFASERRLFGLDNIVIFNGGSSQGVSSGQTLPIYKQQPARNGKSQALQNARLIGQAKVVKVSEGFATAIVISATDDIQVGDSTAPNISR